MELFGDALLVRPADWEGCEQGSKQDTHRIDCKFASKAIRAGGYPCI